MLALPLASAAACLPVYLCLPVALAACVHPPPSPCTLTKGMLTYTSMRWCRDLRYLSLTDTTNDSSLTAPTMTHNCRAPQVLVTTRRHAAVGSCSSRGLPLLRARVLPADVALPSGGRVLLGNRGFRQCIRYRSILGCHWRYVSLSLSLCTKPDRICTTFTTLNTTTVTTLTITAVVGRHHHHTTRY